MSEMEIMRLPQGSPEWLEYRKTKSNASEAGAVMGVNPWFPHNPAELFDLKTGVQEVVINAAMSRGTALEPAARAWLEIAMGNETFTPMVASRGRYSASYDGISFDGDIACEIKCPARADSKLFGLRSPNDIRVEAPHYWWQIVHQMYVNPRLKAIVFLAYGEQEQNTVTIERDDCTGFFDALCEAWERFHAALDAGQRPDDGQDTSEELQMLVHAYRQAKVEATKAEAMLETIKTELIDYARRNKKTEVKGFSASVMQVTKKGSIDYAKVPELQGLDLEKYRKKPSVYWKIDV